jgi:CRP/FNR family transcriptional regulator, cyclic AMP receptor protein
MAMTKRFEGEAGRRRLIDLLREQKMVRGSEELAEELSKLVNTKELKAGDVLIEEGADDTDMYFILDGLFEVVVHGKRIAQRAAGTQVGEMAAAQPGQLRSASVVALGDAVVAKLQEKDLVLIGEKYPDIWRQIARELARRLLERNRFIAGSRGKIRVFIISSVEALRIARAVEDAFEHDNFQVVLWTHDVFKVANYPIEDLERELEVADFAIAIAQPDDRVKSRSKRRSAPRDNVIFELGFFMGRLGRTRAVLMEPRGEDVKLPSDLTGITTISYKFADGDGLSAAMGPACNRLRNHINRLGPHNG